MAGETIVDSRNWPPEDPSEPASIAADAREAARGLLLEITHLVVAYPNSNNLYHASNYARRAAGCLEDFESDG
jgi:hypothetical protein